MQFLDGTNLSLFLQSILSVSPLSIDGIDSDLSVSSVEEVISGFWVDSSVGLVDGRVDWIIWILSVVLGGLAHSG